MLKIHVVADWAEDLSLFTRSLIISEGRAIRTPPLTMELWTGGCALVPKFHIMLFRMQEF